jgi:hypothetical protein
LPSYCVRELGFQGSVEKNPIYIFPGANRDIRRVQRTFQNYRRQVISFEGNDDFLSATTLEIRQ